MVRNKIFAITSIIFLLFLISCQSRSDRLNTELSRASQASIDSFKFNGQCPHICWLGINPGTTTADEAKRILKTSNQIDRQWYRVSDAGFFTYWYPGRSKNFPSSVDLEFQNGLVKSLYIVNVPNTIDDFIKLIGEPDKIRIRVQRAEADYIMYALYFSASKVTIYVSPAKWSGPDPTDTFFTLQLNTEFNNTYPFDWGDVQPWLGYGHIKDYLPNIEIPNDATP